MKYAYPIIMDVDTGIDDAVALVFGATLNKLDLKLVSTCFGNVELKKVVRNTKIILEDINRTDIPVSVGSSKPLHKSSIDICAHGKNGLGGYDHDISIPSLKTNNLINIHNIVNANEMTYIISCAPLTNLAKYIQKYPQDNEKVTLIIVSGLLDINPKNPYLNFNLAKDFDAADIVIKSYKNIVIVPSDMGHKAYIPTLDFHKSAKCGRIGKILADMYPYHLDRTVHDGAAMHDLCGVFYLTNPEMFTIKPCYCSLKTVKKGSYLDFDYKSKKPNALITTDIDVKQFEKLYYNTLKRIK